MEENERSQVITMRGKPAAGNQHLPPSSERNAERCARWAISAAVPTTLCFLQHLGVPSTDISSTGDYGVYHSVFDNFAWFKKFGDPDFRYEQQMARIYGLEVLRMSSADVLPYDYETYGKEILVYLDAPEPGAKTASETRWTSRRRSKAPASCGKRARRMLQKQRKMPGATGAHEC
jgi:hypothetical protein